MGRVALVVVGVSIGVLVGIGAFALVDDEDDGPVIGPGVPAESSFPAVGHDGAAALDLVAAWETWRTATFYARGVWERRLDSGGGPLRGDVLNVQDPPRRVVVRLGALVELTDGSVRSCDADVDGGLAPTCTPSDAGLSYEARVAAEMALVEGYVIGESRVFNVGLGESEGCYRAENRALLPAAPWGLWAEFCFDPLSGAMRSARIRRDSAVDTEVMFEVRDTVSESDFAVS